MGEFLDLRGRAPRRPHLPILADPSGRRARLLRRAARLLAALLMLWVVGLALGLGLLPGLHPRHTAGARSHHHPLKTGGASRLSASSPSFAFGARAVASTRSTTNQAAKTGRSAGAGSRTGTTGAGSRRATSRTHRAGRRSGRKRETGLARKAIKRRHKRASDPGKVAKDGNGGAL